jgi:hypothetical protein
MIREAKQAVKDAGEALRQATSAREAAEAGLTVEQAYGEYLEQCLMEATR